MQIGTRTRAAALTTNQIERRAGRRRDNCNLARFVVAAAGRQGGRLGRAARAHFIRHRAADSIGEIVNVYAEKNSARTCPAAAQVGLGLPARKHFYANTAANTAANVLNGHRRRCLGRLWTAPRRPRRQTKRPIEWLPGAPRPPGRRSASTRRCAAPDARIIK